MKYRNVLIVASLLASVTFSAPIEPTWESLAENYEVPQWLVDGKLGVWMHWGISSAADPNRPNDGSWYGRNMYGGRKKVAKVLSEWHTKRYGPPSEFGYEKMIPLFKAENWDPDALVAFVKENGARFVMPVACHHDNFDMYDSFHPWNSVDMGPKRDTLKEWKEAAVKHGLKFGISTHLYWSPGWFRPARKYQKEGTLEWKLFNMDYDPQNYSKQDSWNKHWYARCWEIVEKYDPDMFNHDSGPYPEVEFPIFISEYINRDLKENNGKQTVVFSTKNPALDRNAFTYNLERGGAGEIKPVPWMWATDLSGGWFYRATATNKMSVPVMLANGVDAISKNGIVMLNIALTGDGIIPEKQKAYLTAFGDFLKINGEGIYGTRPWKTFGEGPLKVKNGRQGENHEDFCQEDIRFTAKGDTLYAFVLAKPTSEILIKTLAQGGTYEGEIGTISLLGSDEKLTWKRSVEALTIKLPKTLPDQPVIGFRITSSSAQQRQADFYVSNSGSDSWSGTLATSNAQGSDGPFATLERARDAVRDLKKQKATDIVVLIREGTYQLKNTVVFGLEDSGEGDSTITYAAYPGETPVFSSGREIKDWQKVSGKLPGLPEEAQGKVWVTNVSDRFLTLYDAEGMLPRAQSERFVPLKGGSKTELRFPKGRLKNWPNVEDVDIVVRPTRAWIMNVLPLVSVDEEAGVARTAIPATYAMHKYGCWVENVLEELDKPGEWVLNTKEGKVYLWPRDKSAVMAPQLIEFIRVEGKIDKRGPKDIPVRNLCFRGLTFKHGERYTLTQDDAGLQHDWDMLDKGNALVRLRDTENCVVEQCHFLHSGSGAIRVDLHGQKNKISGNHIEHMGGGGILLCGYGPGTKDVNKKNLIYNNHIHHVGEIYWHSPGIYVCQSGENRVANNLIHHTNYTALVVSGIVTRFFVQQDKRESVRTIRWHEIGKLPANPTLNDVRPYLHTRNNLIENNEIHHAMQILGDGNGIYIRGAGPGNVIRRNYVHHLVAKTNAQGAIRTDGGQMDTLIAENLIYKCKSQGMTLKLNNRFENNIIADVIAPRGTYLKIVEGPMTGASNKRNIFYSTLADCTFISESGAGRGRVGEDRRGRIAARMKDIGSDHNIYYCKADRSRGDNVLKKLQGDGVDANSRAVDPMFVDPANGDFRLKPNSPALKLDFVPLDMSKVGLQSDEK